MCPTVRTFLQCWLWMVSLVVSLGSLCSCLISIHLIGPKKNTCWFWMNPHRCKQMELDISCSDSGFWLQTTTAFKVKGQRRHVSVNELSWTEWSNLRKSSSQTEVTSHYLLVTTRKGSAIRCSNSNVLGWFETFVQSQTYHFLSVTHWCWAGLSLKSLFMGATEYVGVVSVSPAAIC